MATILTPAFASNAILCSVCKKRPATRSCDCPVGTSRYIGHPPRIQMQEAKQYDVAYKKIEMSKTITCDKPLCDQCTTQISSGFDFCPSHIDEINQKKIGRK